MFYFTIVTFFGSCYTYLVANLISGMHPGAQEASAQEAVDMPIRIFCHIFVGVFLTGFATSLGTSYHKAVQGSEVHEAKAVAAADKPKAEAKLEQELKQAAARADVEEGHVQDPSCSVPGKKVRFPPSRRACKPLSVLAAALTGNLP